MHIADFDYILPPELIAQTPAEPRDSSRLLVVHKDTGMREHHHFYELGAFLKPNDLLIVNSSKVFKARIKTQDFELFLLRPEDQTWLAIGKPSKKLQPGTTLRLPGNQSCTILSKDDEGTLTLDFNLPPEAVFAWADRYGSIPLPPYIHSTTTPDQLQKDYQTTYAKTLGSAAAPTAGLHFTPELIEKLKNQGIRFADITLHVGLGTFRPVKTDHLEDHHMHAEWLDIPKETQNAIQATKAKGGRIIAVGTTSVRALESGLTQGFTSIFIKPGFTFKIIDGLITNFHLPKSTLLVLISALAGREPILAAYHEAIAKKYRFFSFGDAMLII